MIRPSTLSAIAAAALAIGSTVSDAAGEEQEQALRFSVEVDGVPIGDFDALFIVDGADEDEGKDLILRKRPGRTKYGDIVLKRGFSGDDTLYRWWKSVLEEPGLLWTLTVTASDPATGSTVQSWRFYEAFPSKWYGASPPQGKGGSDVAIEELTLSFEGLELE